MNHVSIISAILKVNCETGDISNAIFHVIIFSPIFSAILTFFTKNSSRVVFMFTNEQIIMDIITPVKIFLFIYINNNYAQSFVIS